MKTYEERYTEVAEKRAAEYKQYQKFGKEALLRILGQKMRIHSADLRTPKSDLIGAILDCTNPYPRQPRS